MTTTSSSFLSRHKRALAGAVAAVFVLGGVATTPMLAPVLGTPQALAQFRGQPGFADIVERVKPAVVSVQVRREARGEDRNWRNRGGPEISPNDPLWRFLPPELRERFGRGMPDGGGPRGMGQGSGFFVSADGFVVTNNHVVEGGNTFTVVMDDGTRLEARLVGADARTDVAVLKVERDRAFPFVSFSRTQPRVGDWVIAIGNPFGLGGTVTAGIVSARGREIGAGPYDDFIQIDAPVNRGNSGGPTFNADGEVIGINTAIYSPSGGSVGIGFAIPATLAEQVVTQLRSGGTVTRGWLGVQIQGMTEELARSMGLQRTEGVIVAEPQAGSPAAQAGIRAGDVIVSVDGQPVRQVRDLTRRVADIAPGTSARLEIVRGGNRQTINVTIGRLGDQVQRASLPGNERAAPSPTETFDRLGLELAAGRNGVTVSAIDPNGAAARRGLREGDIIVEIAGEAVTRPEEVAKQIEAARTEGRGSVLARVRSANGLRFVPLPVDRS